MVRALHRLLLLSILPVLLISGASFARELILVEAGELPIILTAPHGGREEVPGCSLRTPTGSRFVTGADLNTDLLARDIAGEITRLTGKRPYLVIARFQRRYIDANRRADEAYAESGCAADYDFYHAAIRRFVDEVRAKYPAAMLFDIHGQAAYRDSILRGTHHGAAVTRLLARAGAPAVTGPDSVFGQFAKMGYRIIPANDTAPTDRVEAKNYTGGHTVLLYGSHNADGIDTMQLEFGRDLRGQIVIGQTAKDGGQAVVAFYRRYLEQSSATAAPAGVLSR